MTTTSKDYYKILGVSESADRDEIRKAYRKLAKEYHPDANPGDEAAADRFKEIGEAHAVLSNEKKRKQYDQMRKLGAFGFGPRRGGAGARPGGRGPGAAGEPGGFSFDDLGGIGGLGDLFSSIFDRGRRDGGTGTRARGTRAGQDVEVEVEVSFLTAARGGTISLTVPITEECTVCGGGGAQPGTSVRRCGECGGTGTVSFGQGGFAVNRPCPACMGRGTIPETPCTGCGGSGTVRQTRKLQVKVPAGVETGSRLRVSGQGERGDGGGVPGDLILQFKVKPHRFFRREGLDIHCTVPINVAQAVLGSRIRVRTIHGKHVVLKIPPGTQSGTRFRVRGQGVTRGERTGDQYVEVRVQVPEELGPEDRERFEVFAEAAGLRH
jgi:molecular chaperone DnaJ